MGPLDMVLAKDALCEVLERRWGAKAATRTAQVLRCSEACELERVFKGLGMEMMEEGHKEGAREWVATWRARSVLKSAGDQWKSPSDEEEEEEAPKASIAAGIAKGFGKAFSKSEASTTDDIASAHTNDHQGSVTEWQGEDELSVAAKRLFAAGKVSIELAKAELSAVARSKLGHRADRIVDMIESANAIERLELAVGVSQRKLVRAGMPRLAAKMAKKWLEMRGRVA